MDENGWTTSLHATVGKHIALTAVVEALCAPDDRISQPGRGAHHRQLLPSRNVLIDMVRALRAVLFPGYFSDWDLSEESMKYYVGATLDRVLHAMQEQVKRGLCMRCDRAPNEHHECDERAAEITRDFLSRLPRLRKLLASDVQAAYEGDPAASGHDEVIFSYPGLRAITAYRLAHELYLLDVPLIPRIITEHAHSATGIDLHPGATVGPRFFIDHGTGVVIGETTIIGENVRIYQGVTLGAKSFPLDDDGRPIKGIPRHPIVEDNVIIYSGATILGRITIGAGSVVGGNIWLTRSVAPGSFVSQREVRQGIFEDGGGI